MIDMTMFSYFSFKEELKREAVKRARKNGFYSPTVTEKSWLTADEINEIEAAVNN